MAVFLRHRRPVAKTYRAAVIRCGRAGPGRIVAVGAPTTKQFQRAVSGVKSALSPPPLGPPRRSTFLIPQRISVGLRGRELRSWPGFYATEPRHRDASSCMINMHGMPTGILALEMVSPPVYASLGLTRG